MCRWRGQETGSLRADASGKGAERTVTGRGSGEKNGNGGRLEAKGTALEAKNEMAEIWRVGDADERWPGVGGTKGKGRIFWGASSRAAADVVGGTGVEGCATRAPKRKRCVDGGEGDGTVGRGGDVCCSDRRGDRGGGVSDETAPATVCGCAADEEDEWKNELCVRTVCEQSEVVVVGDGNEGHVLEGRQIRYENHLSSPLQWRKKAQKMTHLSLSANHVDDTPPYFILISTCHRDTTSSPPPAHISSEHPIWSHRRH